MKKTFGFLMGLSVAAMFIAGTPAAAATALAVIGYRIA